MVTVMAPLDQLQSPLFGRLPFELRAQILRLALGGRVLHLGMDLHTRSTASAIDESLGLRRCVCRGNDLESWFHPCWTSSPDALDSARARTDEDHDYLLAPLLACKRIYEEAMDVLYAANTFHFRDLDALARLTRALPSDRLAQVQSLKLTIRMMGLPDASEAARKQYEMAWRDVAKLDGLRELRVWITFVEPVCTTKAWRRNEEFFLEPWAKVRPLRRFDLFLPVDGEALSGGADCGTASVFGADKTTDAMMWSAIALAALTAHVTTAQAPTATIASGLVVGTTTQYPGATATNNKFLGIPFAKSPPLRFGLPEPPEKWSAPLDATAYRQGCVQQNSSPGLAANESEDCLYLNVFTPPGTQAGAGKPVMFWIYGGNLQTGMASDPTFDGSLFAANQDVVLVTTNYRLNAFGFSSSPSIEPAQQNVGFYDQRLALSWVQSNIEAFGGEPDKVTIFGESAGGYSVKYLVLRPPTPLPFRAAIMESQGTVIDNSGPQSWNTLSEKLGCGAGDDSVALACVRSRDAALIKSVIANNSLGFPPTDDDTTFISDLAIRDSFKAHKVADVPILIGTNGQELSPIAYMLGLNGVQLTTLVTQLTAALPALSTLLGNVLSTTLSENAAYELVTTIFTDVVFQCPAATLARLARDNAQPTWRYLYNASFPNTQLFPGSGAYHAAELTTVFGTYPRPGATSQQIALSAYMQRAWALFAKNPVAGPGWPAYGANMSVGDLGANGSDGETTIAAADIDQLCPLTGGGDVLRSELQRSNSSETIADVLAGQGVAQT